MSLMGTLNWGRISSPVRVSVSRRVVTGWAGRWTSIISCFRPDHPDELDAGGDPHAGFAGDFSYIVTWGYDFDDEFGYDFGVTWHIGVERQRVLRKEGDIRLKNSIRISVDEHAGIRSDDGTSPGLLGNIAKQPPKSHGDFAVSRSCRHGRTEYPPN